MKILINILLLLTTLISFTACADIDPIDNGIGENNSFAPIGDGQSQFHSVYGTVNGSDNVSIIATADYFEVSGFPSADIMKYLGNAEIQYGATIGNTIVLRDLIPYSIERTIQYYVPENRYLLEILPHNMNFLISRDGKTEAVTIDFEPIGSDNYMMLTKTESGNYWVYNFTITSTRMTVGGVPLDDFKGTDYLFRIYYRPSY